MRTDSSNARGPIAWMARNHVTANLLMVAFIVGGLVMSTQIQQEVFPDLVLIDGGKGQLNAAVGAFEEQQIDPPSMISLAKREEEVFLPGQSEPLRLSRHSFALRLLQYIRDEAHRFAIGTHRAKRSKALTANPLDEITGVGPSRKRALLAHFGSAKAVSRAGVEDLKDVPGISAEMAQKIYDFFHEKRA